MIRRPPRSTRTDTLFPYTTLFRSHAPDGQVFLQAQGNPVLPGGKDADLGMFSRPARPAPLRERRGTLSCLLAVRGCLPDAGDPDGTDPARGRHTPHHALRQRPAQTHFLWFLR